VTDAAMDDRFTEGLQLYRGAGNTWTLVFDGQVCRLEDAGGVRLLASLLSHPNEEISALVLEQNLLRMQDLSPASARRQLHDARERACAAVGEAIDDVLGTVARQHPALAQHLRASLQLGIHCAYVPES
jgi:hypothetical protein